MEVLLVEDDEDHAELVRRNLMGQAVACNITHVNNGEAARVALLRDMGFWIAVDDMGAGYAGLKGFAVLRPDIVKLAMSIVRGIDLDPYRKTRSMTAMCCDFGIPLVAEGVETQDEKSVLVELGCDFLQGFLGGAPKAPNIRPSGSPSRAPAPTEPS